MSVAQDHVSTSGLVCQALPKGGARRKASGILVLFAGFLVLAQNYSILFNWTRVLCPLQLYKIFILYNYYSRKRVSAQALFFCFFLLPERKDPTNILKRTLLQANRINPVISKERNDCLVVRVCGQIPCESQSVSR